MVAKKKKKCRGNPNPKNQVGKGNKLAVGHGRPKMTEHEKEMSLKSRTQFKNMLNKYSGWTLAEIKVALEEKALPIFDMAMLKHLELMMEDGDAARADWTLNHIFGKEKEIKHVHMTGGLENTNPINLKDLSVAELKALKKMQEKSK